MSSRGDPACCGAMLVVAGIFALWGAKDRFKKKQFVENIPTSEAHSVAMGLVEMAGTIVPIKLLKSPLSNADCVYYNFTVEELRRSGKHSHWVTIFSRKEHENFFIKDATGQVEIDPGDAEIDIPEDRQVNVNSMFFENENETEVKKCFEKLNISTSKGIALGPITIGGSPKRKITEWYLAPGGTVYVLGTAEPKPGVSSAKHEDMVIIQKGTNNPLFYISDRSEKETLNKLKNDTYWMLIGGLCGIVFGLGIIFARFNAL
jgi:hypothetical protein